MATWALLNRRYDPRSPGSSPPSSQLVLDLDRPRHHFGSDRYFVETSALLQDRFVVRKIAGAEEDLEVHDRTRGDRVLFEQSSQAARDGRVGEPGERGLVSQVPRAQRHALDITLGLLRSRPSIRAKRSA